MVDSSVSNGMRWLPTVLAFAIGIAILAVGAYLLVESMWLLSAGDVNAGNFLGPIGFISLVLGGAIAVASLVNSLQVRRKYLSGPADTPT